MNHRTMLSFAALLAAAALWGQNGPEAPDAPGKTHVVTYTGSASGPNMFFQADPAAGGVRQFAMEYIGAEVGPGKVVKGSPYSADAVTESTQTLADGNRIQHTSTTRVYRDSQGRTRREAALGAVGLAPGVELPKLVFISDPVAGFNYVLNLKDRTATRSKIGAAGDRLSVLHSKLLAAPPSEERHVELRGETGETRRTEVRTFTYSVSSSDSRDSKAEALGQRNMEGVVVEGTRTTFTIPAGRIGNERPIDIVSERWFSSELQTVVSSRHSDPRNGETTFRLANISRSEPPAAMFEVPADFKVTESTGEFIKMRVPAPAK